MQEPGRAVEPMQAPPMRVAIRAPAAPVAAALAAAAALTAAPVAAARADGAAYSAGGSYSGTAPLELVGQSSGFMGIECSDVFCRQGGAYVVLDPAGAVLYRSASERIPYTSDRVPPNPAQINDPTGGMIRVRLKDDGSNYLLLLDAIDASGGIRWTRQVPETWPDTGIVPVPIVGV